MSADSTLARLNLLPVRLRIAHLAALLRWERKKNALSSFFPAECERSLSCPSPASASRSGEGSGTPDGRPG